MHKGVWSTWLRRGFIDRGTRFATTAGVPPGGMISPVVSNLVWDGLEAVVHGGSWHRRVHHINDVRWADDCSVTANSRQVLEAQLIDTLNPVLREWANDHRHVIYGETCATLDNFVWRRLYRWAKLRHPNKTGYWLAMRYFPHQPGESWRFTDPATGKRIIRVREVVKPQRYVKVKGDANPFDPAWEAYFQGRDRQLALQASSGFRAKVLRQQDGRCLVCRQVLQCEEALERHHRDGDHQHNRLMNLALLHPNCHRQVHHAPDRNTHAPRSLQGVGQA